MIKDNGRPSAGTSPRGVFKSLIPGIVRALGDQGYVTPTPIQTQCIPPLLAGRDVLGTAQTGTGKTAAFSLPILQQLSRRSLQRKSGTPRALILAPTRELAAQIAESVEAYGSYLPVRTVIVFGGVKQ
ncbi:MAG TPA: DEAD/DEAH box helicase, partial [Candidatus Sabulitectum sp.]|nr:DEAD/DEAH box helicase [Candidatus Sabulitectum sp.]